MSNKNPVHNFFRASAEDFTKIPGNPVAYWIPKKMRENFSAQRKLSFYANVRQGIKTGNNDKHLRYWFEVASETIFFPHYNINCKVHYKWFTCTKGGNFKKWYGNYEYVLNWEDDGYEIKNYVNNNGKLLSRPQNTKYFFHEGITWSSISSSDPSFRLFRKNMTFESKGSVIFVHDDKKLLFLQGLLNSKVTKLILKIISPTLDFSEGSISRIPVNIDIINFDEKLITNLLNIAKSIWDSYEQSFDFKLFPLIVNEYNLFTIEKSYNNLYNYWNEITEKTKQLEEQNNRIFIEAYGLQDELTPDVPLEEITLTCNPYYRYGNNKSEEELEALLLSDTMRELVSYAVGCIFGRYSLDKEGLVLANAGEGIEEYLRQIPAPSLTPDESGILPLTEEDDFSDDLPTQVRRFIRTAFSGEHAEQNIRFIEDAVGKDLRTFLLRDFYKDHIKRYKKRPIYWMISSPKGSFRALIYLHRYTPDTVGRLLNEYVRPFMSKLQNKMDNEQHQLTYGGLGRAEQNRVQKSMEKHRADLREISDWERQVYDIASKRIVLDLDDGVKVNYQKLGPILEPVKGLNM